MTKVSLTMLMIIGLAGGIVAGCATQDDEPDPKTSTTQQQLPSQSCDFFCYSDLSKTVAVGMCTRYCDGQLLCSGEFTPFQTAIDCFACF